MFAEKYRSIGLNILYYRRLKGLSQEALSIKAGLTRSYISKIERPLLVIHGEHDEYATLSQPERLIQLANGYKELKILKDCGHFPHKEKETEVITTIQSFLEKI